MKIAKYNPLLLSLYLISLAPEICASNLNPISALRRVRQTIDLSQVSNEQKIVILKNRIIGPEIPLAKGEVEWVNKQAAAAPPKTHYLIWLKNVQAVINPGGQIPIKVFYLGIGPYADFIDLVSPLLATNYTFMVGMDRQELSFQEFRTQATLALEQMPGIEILGFKKLADFKYSVGFRFLNKEREVIVYYGVDGNYSFPEELKPEYDVIYSRWMGSVFDPTENRRTREIRDNWLRYLNPKTGFLIVDGEDGYPYFDSRPNGFWKAFLEVPLGERGIPTAVIANVAINSPIRVAHLLVRKNPEAK